MDGTAPATTCGLEVPVDGRFEPARRRDVLIVLAAFNVFAHSTPKRSARCGPARGMPS